MGRISMMGIGPSGPGVPPPELPVTITGLRNWWDASYLASITKDGSNLVSTWADLGPAAKNLTAATTRRPTWTDAAVNGLAALVFDGTSDAMQTAADAEAIQPWSVVMVVKRVTSAGYSNAFDGRSNGNCRMGTSSGTTLTPYAGSYANAAAKDWGNNVLHIVTAVFNGASTKQQIDNGSTGTDNGGTNNPGGFTIGAHGASIAEFSEETVCEIITAVADITADANFADLKTYLKNKWGTP